MEWVLKMLLSGVTFTAFIYGWHKLLPVLKGLRKQQNELKSEIGISNITQMDIRRTIDATKAAVDFTTVTAFETAIAEFFGAPYAVATDSCTHGLELCLRRNKAWIIDVPRHTYLSVPMLAAKLRINLCWTNEDWKDCYEIATGIWDAAVMWGANTYKEGQFMCLSFQYQKHLSLGRGGIILCPDAESAAELRKMAYDGRTPGVPWRDQNIEIMGYHYYMTPDTAAEGLRKLPAAIKSKPRQWSTQDWSDLSNMTVFKKKQDD